METHKPEVSEVEHLSMASNGSLLQSMLQRLRKDDSSRSLHLGSLGERSAEENNLSGGDYDQEASSRKFNTQVAAKKQWNADSPTVIPKWERRQLFLHPFALDKSRNLNQESEDEDTPDERDSDSDSDSDSEYSDSLRGCKFQNTEGLGSGLGLRRVLPLSSMESPTPSTKEMLSDPSTVQTHNKPISNTSCYRVRKVTVSDFQTNAKDLGMDSLDMDRCSTHTTTQDPSLKRGVTGSTGSSTSLGNVSDKWKNTVNITENPKEMWRERGESSQDKENLYLEPDPQSVEEAMISPFYEEPEPSEVKTCLQRTFTLRDFKLDLGSMNLMEEVFTGDEWSKYLPVEKCPSQEEDTEHSQTSSVHTCDNNELSVTASLEDHHLKPVNHSQSVHSHENTDIQRTGKEEDQGDSGVESSAYIYALQTDDVDKKTKPDAYCNNIYDYVEYLIPMPSNLENSKSTTSLDFSVIESQLLDNSMLKTRISLGKKRKHRPSGKRQKEKSNSTFYNVPSSVLQPPMQSVPSTRSSPSPQPTVFPSSVFYLTESLEDSTSSQSLKSVTEKSKPKWKGFFPKTKGKTKH